MNTNKIIIVALVAVGLSFYAGMKYSGSKTVVPSGVRFQQISGMGMRGGQKGMGNMGFANGEIISKTDTGLTLKLQDGGSKIILISASTTVYKSIPGLISELKTNDRISVTGVPNPDGSVTASSIRIGDFPIQMQIR
jgi:hypothetical protein